MLVQRIHDEEDRADRAVNDPRRNLRVAAERTGLEAFDIEPDLLAQQSSGAAVAMIRNSARRLRLNVANATRSAFFPSCAMIAIAGPKLSRMHPASPCPEDGTCADGAAMMNSTRRSE